ncbi:MAG: hypothetical protein KDD62_12685, partial [Bdellovibrionales bacterium]|nr:hypothetical protein [Bdellovibrionales bacterium]
MKTLFVPLMIILAAQTLHAAQPKCESREERQEIGSTQGSADIISNFLKRSGSLAVECDEAVQEGFEQLESQAAPEDLCGSGCGAATAQVYLKTVPEEFLQSYPDQATCDQMLIQTKKQPLIYKA